MNEKLNPRTFKSMLSKLFLIIFMLLSCLSTVNKVWILGDSYVRRSEDHARETMGTNLGVRAHIQWFGRGGMCWDSLLHVFHQCLKALKLLQMYYWFTAVEMTWDVWKACCLSKQWRRTCITSTNSFLGWRLFFLQSIKDANGGTAHQGRWIKHGSLSTVLWTLSFWVVMGGLYIIQTSCLTSQGYFWETTFI